MSYLFKDFLRLEDVGEYLNQYGYSFNPEVEEDYYKLKNTILDLYHENKLDVVFYYDDFAVIKTLRFSENLAVEEIKEEQFESYISGYFHVPEVKMMIEDGGYLKIIKSTYGCYHLYDKEKLPVYYNEYKVEAGHKFTSIEFGNNLAPSVIEFPDLRFPKADLDKLFNKKNIELKNVKDELADVKAQNAKLIADREESKATGSFMMGTPTVEHGESKTNEQLAEELAAANYQIADLENQLAQVKAELANKPANDVQLQGIAKYNADKAYVISTSQALADYIWSMDNKKAIRTGDMVQQIRHVMHNVAPNLIPDDKAIRDWLSGIAPDYAKKGGKTPKNAPSEISLIMKK